GAFSEISFQAPTWDFRFADPRPPRKGEGKADRLPLSQFAFAFRRVTLRGTALRYDVRQQAEEAGALDGLGQFALLLLGNGGDAGRDDLAALGNVARQQLDVLVVDARRIGARERAGLAAAVERAAGRRCGRSISHLRISLVFARTERAVAIA